MDLYAPCYALNIHLIQNSDNDLNFKRSIRSDVANQEPQSFFQSSPPFYIEHVTRLLSAGGSFKKKICLTT